jgi:hypothetical protein
MTAHLRRPCPGCLAPVPRYQVQEYDSGGVACRFTCRNCSRVWHVEPSGIWEARTPCHRCGTDCEAQPGGLVWRLEPAQAGWRVLCAPCHQAWRDKLASLIVLVSRYPEQVVDAFLRMAEAAGTSRDVTNNE